MDRPAARTLAGVVAEKARTAPARPAILFDRRSITYAELVGHAEDAAKALLALGIGNGDRIGVLLGNDPDWVILSLAASMVGAGFVPLNTWYKKSELAWTIRHCGLSLLIVAPRFLKTDYAALFGELIPELGHARPGALRSREFPALRTIIFLGDAPPGAMRHDDFLRQGRTVSDEALAGAAAAVDPDGNAFILYTSGSTAEPKGVLLNHRGVVENGFDLGRRRGIDSEDRVWLGSPLFYGLGATNPLPATFTNGATLVLQGHFDAGAAIDIIHRTGASVYYGTGNMTRAILDHPDYAQRKIRTLQKGNAGTMPEYKRLTLVEMARFRPMA